jgi:hypothetical protein
LRNLIVFPLFLLAAAMAAGCSSSARRVERPDDPTRDKLDAIMVAYKQFTAAHNQPPANAEELKPFLKAAGKPDELLQSPRDGQPFVILWGVDIRRRPDWAKNRPVRAYEQRGGEQGRYVLSIHGQVELVSEQDFRASQFPPQHKPVFKE